MDFESPTMEGRILKRYKRFLADIKLKNGEIITAHLANTGSMKTCWEPDWKALVSFHDNPKRKLKYSVEMIHNGETWIGVNTSRPNHLVREALEKGLIEPLKNFSTIKPEYRVEKSRLDFFLQFPNQECFVEVKNVTLLGADRKALFPDAVTERGQKHLKDLITLKQKGYRTVLLFTVQREDVDSFSPAHHIDPQYSRLLHQAVESGVEVMAYQCRLTPQAINLTHPLPVELS